MRKLSTLGSVAILVAALFFPYNIIGKVLNRDQFVSTIGQQARIANQDIMQQRQQLLALYHSFLNQKTLSTEQMNQLHTLTKQYKLKNFNVKQTADWQTLLQRIDIIPIALVTAQAINESAWGTSRFAREGNNYFGQWCYSRGCGIVPKKRASGEIFEVQRFPSMLASVQAYMRNLNTLHLYHDLRVKRHIIRLAGRPVTGLKLVGSLSMYSIRRGAYVRSITSVINRYHLTALDQQELPVGAKPKKGLLSWL